MTTRVALTEANVKALSLNLREPEWLTQRRLEAFRAYEAMAMPDPDLEEWRRTDLSGFDLESAVSTPGGATGTWQAGGFNPVVYAKGNLPQAFFFGDLRLGIHYHEDVIREHLHSLVRPAEWKLAALQAALWQQATFVYVPRGVEVEVPLEYTVDSQGFDVYPHVLIVAEEGSSVTVLQDCSSSDGHRLSSGAVEIIARQDSRVRFVDVQRWGSNTYAFSTIKAKLDKGAEVTAALVGLGGRLARTRLDVDLAGEGSRAELLGLSYGDASQHFDYVTLQDHVAPRTTSDLTFKTALAGESSAVWQGTVRIQKGASLSDAGQSSRNLLLSDGAKAAPIPILEIEAYDILRCSHGASAGPIDEEQRFYLESRGIPPLETQRLLVDAFFQQVIDRLPHESIRDRVAAALSAKLGREIETDEDAA